MELRFVVVYKGLWENIMDYNNGNEGNAQGMQGRGMPMQGMSGQNVNQGQRMPGQGMPPFRGPQGQGPQGYNMQGRQPNGIPAGGMQRGQGMPMQGMPGQNVNPGQMPRGQGMMPGQNGMPMQGYPGRGIQGAGGQGFNQQGPGQQGRSVNNMKPGQGMSPFRGPQGQGPQGYNMQGRSDAGAARRDPDMQMRSRPVGRNSVPNRKPVPDEPDERETGKRGNRLFGDGNESPGRRMGTGMPIGVPQGLVESLSGVNAYIFVGILVICLLISVIAYGTAHKGKSKVYVIPKEMVTYNGLFKDVYDNAVQGKLSKPAGAALDEDGSELPAPPKAAGEQSGETGDDAASDTGAADGSGSAAGAPGGGASEGTTSGATMVLDSGAGVDGYTQAESYNELLTQLEKAIAAGDTAFVGSKIGYADDSGSIKGYPQSVVDHFVTYMSTNSDKRSALLSELANDKYSAQEEGVFLVKFPLIKFVVNMGYDGTTISLSGFTDQEVNAGQSADIAPLLPCMYTLTISNPAWAEPVTRDIEANVNETTISINIKP